MMTTLCLNYSSHFPSKPSELLPTGTVTAKNELIQSVIVKGIVRGWMRDLQSGIFINVCRSCPLSATSHYSKHRENKTLKSSCAGIQTHLSLHKYYGNNTHRLLTSKIPNNMPCKFNNMQNLHSRENFTLVSECGILHNLKLAYSALSTPAVTTSTPTDEVHWWLTSGSKSLTASMPPSLTLQDSSLLSTLIRHLSC